MSRIMNNSHRTIPAISRFAGVACFGAALLVTPLSAAGTAKAHTNRPATRPAEPSRTQAEQPQGRVETPQDTASGYEVAPEPDPLVGRTKFDWQAQTAASKAESEAASAREKQAKDNQRMTTHVGDARPIAIQDFHPFPKPAPAAQVSEPMSRKTLYWIGASGVALAAGVAAYFIFSGEEEPERVHTFTVPL